MDFFVEPDNIWVASSDGNLADVRKLVASGVDVNAQDEYGYSPLHAAASYGEMEVLEFLLSVGANVQLRDEDGDTPLLVSEKPEIFQRLIQAGADPLATNTNGQGILQKAVEDDNEELINFLRENGYITDPNFKYTPGQSEMEEFLDMLEPVAEGEGNNEENDDAEDADMDEAGN